MVEEDGARDNKTITDPFPISLSLYMIACCMTYLLLFTLFLLSIINTIHDGSALRKSCLGYRHLSLLQLLTGSL